jgi:hypothetical protein
MLAAFFFIAPQVAPQNSYFENLLFFQVMYDAV